MSEPANSGSANLGWEELLGLLRQREPGQWLSMLRADQHVRWACEQRIPAEAYLNHLASLPLDEETSIDLIYSEVLLRTERGERVSPDEYVLRFPHYAGPLRQQLELLRAVQLCGDVKNRASSRDSCHDPETIGNEGVDVAASEAVTLDRPPPPDQDLPAAPPGYTLLKLLGRGGMGVVYLAHQHGLNRLVALKMIRSDDLGDEEARSRFKREATTAAHLNHPNIVQIFEVGEWRTDDAQPPIPFFSLEYCSEGNLAAYIATRTLTPSQAVELVETLARAVQYAHGRGVIHRDLKPANVLLGHREVHHLDGSSLSPLPDFQCPTPKIADFGLARYLELDPCDSRTQAIIGTPGYMAPEQVGHQKVGAAADVHGLGAILYELLAGKPPYKGKTILETLEAICFTEPPAPSQVRATVHRDLDVICLKCLQKDAGERYASAGELADELRRFLNGEPILARPNGPLERFGRWCRRHPARVALVAVSTLALLVITIGIVSYRVRVGEANERAWAEQRARESSELAERGEHYHSLLEQIREGVRIRPPGWTVAARENLRQACTLDTSVRDPVELRTEAVQVLAGLDLNQKASHTHNSLAGAVAFHPDGKRLAVAELKASLWTVGAVLLIDLEDAARTRSLPVLADANWTLANRVQDGVRSLTFSTDGRWLVAGTRSGWVYRWDLDRAAAVQYWRVDKTAIEGLALSKSATILFASSPESGVLSRWDLTGQPRRTAVFSAGSRLFSAALSPAGEVLACCGDGRIALLNPDTLTPLRADLPVPALQLAFSPNGRFLAVESEARLRILDRETGRQARLLGESEAQAPHDSTLDHMVFSPDGALLATACHDESDRKVRIWDVASGRPLTTLFLPGLGPLCPAFAPDGRTLAVACDRQVQLYALTGRDACRMLALQAYPLQAFAFDPEGRRLACVSEQPLEHLEPRRGDVSVWDVARNTLAVRRPFELARGSAARPSIAFLPGDSGLAWCASTPAIHRESLVPGQQKARDVNHLGTMTPAADGRQLWTAAGAEVCSWDAGDLRPRTRWTNFSSEGLPQIYGLAAGRSWIVAGGRDGRFHVLSAKTANRETSGAGPGGPIGVAALAPDESFAILGSQHGKLRLVRVPDGERLGDLPAHGDAVEALAFDGTGQWLATGSRDRSVRLWRRDGQSYRPLLTLRSLPGPVAGLWLSPKGDRLGLLVQREAGVRVWDLEWLRQRCVELGIGW